jgi:hypothetical protein
MPSQAFLTWLETYRSYSGDELNDEIDSLKRQKSIFVSQAIGSKSFTRDLAELRDQLAAAIRAKQNQSNVGNSGATDFSGVCVS